MNDKGKRKGVEGRGGKVFFFGLPQHEEFVFALDSKGNIIRAPLGTSELVLGVNAEIQIPEAVVVEPGYNYFVDSDGDVIAAPDSSHRTERQPLTHQQLAAEEAELQALSSMLNSQSQSEFEALKMVKGKPLKSSSFWHLISEAQSESSGKLDVFESRLRTLLAQHSPDEIRQFDSWYNDLMLRANKWDIWGAACIINAGCGDDGFEYFRSWLISQGESVYSSALNSPDTLADFELRIDSSTGVASFEALAYVAREVYLDKTGKEMPFSESDLPLDVQGEDWDEDDLPRLLPKLAEKFASQEGD